MLTVYGRRNSSNCAKVFWLLEELDQPFELVPAGRGAGARDPEEIRRLSPTGTVPVAIVDGQALWESNAILRCLASLSPAGSLWPDAPSLRACIDSWMDWASQSLSPPLGRLRKDRKAGRAADTAAALAAFSILDRHLNGAHYLTGDTLSIADIAIAPAIYRWRVWDGAAQDDLPELPHLLAYRMRLKEHAGYRRHIEHALG